MKPNYFKTPIVGRDRWMISYVDVLTILLIFFVAIVARGLPALQVLPPAPVPAAKPAPPPPVAPDPHPALAEAQRRLALQHLDLRMEARGLVISLPQTILFSSGDDQIGPDALPVVRQIADVLRDLPNRVSLIGNADSVPIHNRRFKNNWELSAARGLRLLEALSGTYGIPEARLSVSSEGAYRPRGPNDSPEGRATNRRVEIVILDEPVLIVP